MSNVPITSGVIYTLGTGTSSIINAVGGITSYVNASGSKPRRLFSPLETSHPEMVAHIYQLTLRCFYEELSKTSGLAALTAEEVGYMNAEDLFGIFGRYGPLVDQIIETRAEYHEFQRTLVR